MNRRKFLNSAATAGLAAGASAAAAPAKNAIFELMYFRMRNNFFLLHLFSIETGAFRQSLTKF